MSLFRLTRIVFLCFICSTSAVAAADPRIDFGLAQLRAVLPAGVAVVTATADLGRAEAYSLEVAGKTVRTTGHDPAGILYGCLDLAQRIRENHGKLPDHLAVRERPALSMRGTCILLMKLGLYDYPVTPQEFPFFYDKQMWTDYLDFLAENRFNYIAFWNGHPFDYFVKLDKYPEAQSGLSPELLQKNHDMLMWLGTEAQKRNIWLMFQFYNIHTSPDFARAHDLPLHGNSAPTPLLTDYTGYCIEKFVKEFPSVGLYICPGERLGVQYTDAWINDVIFAAVRRTGKHPPIMIRAWGIDLPHMRKVAGHYEPLYTERKYNVEMLASDHVDPENLDWSKMTGQHVVNVHCIANLEPFRWSPPSYIQRCIQSSINEGGATGLHLYPRKAWRWPYGCDISPASQVQWERDWLWFEAWGRYAWNPNRERADEKQYWTARLTQHFGDRPTADAVLACYESAADVLPGLQRLIWLGNDNHSVLSAGITLPQLLSAPGAPFLKDLGAVRIPDYLAALRKGEQPSGATPVDFFAERLRTAESALQHAQAALASKKSDETASLASDASAVVLVARFYLHKLEAAVAFDAWQPGTGSLKPLQEAAGHLRASLDDYRQLTALTGKTYESISDVPMWRPIGGFDKCPFHWRDLLPYFEEEYATFAANLAAVKAHPERVREAPLQVTPAAITPTRADQPLGRVEPGGLIYTDRDYTFGKTLPAELVGLPTIRFCNDVAKVGPCPVGFRCDGPVRVFVAFNREHGTWSPPPADWRRFTSGYTVANIETEICWKDFPAGEHELRFDRGTFVIVGFAQADAHLPALRPGTAKREFLRGRLAR